MAIGIGGSDPPAGFLAMAGRELGPKRVIYGNDIGGRGFACRLAEVQGANVPDRAKRLILGENLKRPLVPILCDRGIRI